HGKDASATRATLVVAVLQPREADVHVRGTGGEWRGKLTKTSTFTMFKELPAGGYDGDVASQGASPYPERVERRAGRSPVVTASFESAPGTLRLKVIPRTAGVWVDGVQMSADDPIALRVGKHEVRVAAEGYAQQRFPIEAHTGERVDRGVELVKLHG